IVPMDISISLLKDADGSTIGSVCLARDLSERKQAEAALKHAQEELSRYSRDLERQVRERTQEITSILRYTPAVVYIKDGEGRYTLVNSRFEEVFGLRNEQIRGKTDHEVFSQAMAEQFRASDLRVLAYRESYQVEEVIPQPDGPRTYLSVKFPIYNTREVPIGLGGIATDITAQKRAQDQLRRLSGSIMANQEQERRAIARELHDELGQLLTALRMDAVWLSARLRPQDPKASDRALAMCQVIDHTIDEVRSLATRLRPGVLDDLGLLDALDWYITDFEKRTGITCVFKHRNVPEVDGIGATAAYRIAQEALTNVTRHAEATRVKVSLQPEKGALILAVVDNGRGFDPQEIAASECLGLAGMRERAGLLGGSLEIRSRPGKGTKVYFRLPVEGCGGFK
ncbi:MAG: PAS domain-containing protein, partial [Deltaproteobacteria bacterium]